MNSNITEQQYSDNNLELAEPHFDEEATMLSARPVVPLDRIREGRSRKHLAFGLSIVASLFVGGLAATFMFKQRGQKPAAEITGAAIAGSGANATDPDGSVASNGEVKADVQAATPTPEDPETRAPVQVPVKRPEPKVSRRVTGNTSETEPLEPISWAERREMRRAERIEERRLRRQAAREDQDGSPRRRRSADDLLRIREIFEGSRRP